MALRNFSKMLFRSISSGSRVAAENGGGIETKHIATKNGGGIAKHISDEKLRSLAVRLEQATEEANQLADECKAYFALKRAFTLDRLVYIGLCASLGSHIAEEAVKIRRIKVKDSKLAAYLAKESQSPA